jgi:uncharacterized membrane protein YkoI
MKAARFRKILPAIFLFLAGSVQADPAGSKVPPLPAVVQQTVSAQSPQGTVISVEPKTMDGAMRYKVGVQDHGKKRTLVIEGTGKLLVTKTEVAADALPAPVRQTLSGQSQGATIETHSEVSRAGKTYYEIELKTGGHKKEIVIEPSGELTKVEEVVPVDTVPAPVRSAIDKQASRGKLLKVKTIVVKGKLTAYEAAVDVNGLKTEFKLTPEGQPLK